MFLILRCKPSETLAVVAKLQRDRAMLRLIADDIQCPRRDYVYRVGRQRHRDRRTETILPSYIFVRWRQRADLAHGLPRVYAGLSVMRDVFGNFATCQEHELRNIAATGFTKPT